MARRRSSASSGYKINSVSRDFIHLDGEMNTSIMPIDAIKKLAEIGQFHDQPDAVENVEVNNIITSLNLKEDTVYDKVRITPSYMEFKDPSEGTTFRRTMTIRNIGKLAAFVRICEPSSITLKINTLKKGVTLNPGLSLTRSVIYSFKRPALLHSTIPIEINDQIIDYHIICSFSIEYVAIEPTSVDFGIVDIGRSSEVKIITISNVGGKSTRFTIDLGKNDIDVSVKPQRGVVRPGSTLQLHVKMIGSTEGTFCNEFWIKSRPNIRVPVKVKVIIPRLVIYYPNTTSDFILINFRPTLINTKRYDTMVLRNISSLFSSFVVLGEIDNELVPIKDINPIDNPAYSVFKINPIEGRLQSFEGTIFNIEFSPIEVSRNSRGNKSKINQDFVAFIRILRVHCTEIEDIIKAEARPEPSADFPPLPKFQMQQEFESNSNSAVSSISSLDETSMETVRICIYGETEVAQLLFVPDELFLDTFESGGIESRVIKIENPLKNNELMYRFVPNGIAHCEPSEYCLGPGKSIQILLKIGGKQILYVKPIVKLAFDVIVKNRRSYASRKLIDFKISTFYVNCFVKCGPMKTTKPANNLSSESSSVPMNSLRLTEPSAFACNETQIRLKKSQRKYWADYLRTLYNYKYKIAESDKWKKTALCCEDSNESFCKFLDKPKLEKMSIYNLKRLSENMKMNMLTERRSMTLIPLSPLEIYKIKVSPTIFKFGSVVTKSTSFKELVIANKNNFPVKMRLVSLSTRNLYFPSGNTMILNPDCIVKKMIEFRADDIGKFNNYIGYIINDNHSFELTVTADVVDKFLSLGSRELVLGSDEYFSEECYRPLEGYIEVKNKLNARTNFKWEVPASASYKIDPLIGSVPGGRNHFVSIKYEPDIIKNENTKVIMVSEGGTYMTLKLNTLWSVPTVAFLNETLNVGSIPLNFPYQATGFLHNAEYIEVMFEIKHSLMNHGWDIYPRKGIIPPRGFARIQVTLKFPICLNFDITIEVLVQKCLKLKLKIIGQVTYPMLKLSPSKIEMRRIRANAFQTHPVTATNTGNSLLSLRFPLEAYPEFLVSLSATEQSSELETERIIISPGKTVTFYLQFRPVDLASYAFYLPIITNEILGPALIDNKRSLKSQEYLSSKEALFVGFKNIDIIQIQQTLPTIFIDCTVAGHVISFSKLSFSFDTSSYEIEDVLRVSNNTVQETAFIIRIDELQQNDYPFKIEWESGMKPEFTENSIACILPPDSNTCFRIKFNPKDRSIEFVIEAPIFVRNEFNDEVFNYLKLRGRNPKASIELNTFEIYLAPVPLMVENTTKFQLLVKHFKKCANIVATIMKPESLLGELKKDSLTVKFPNGSLIDPHRKKSETIEVCLTFRSDTSVSFRTMIRFHDSENQAESFVTVFATSDNCLLTTHAHSQLSSDVFKMNNFDLYELSYQSFESKESEYCSVEKQILGGSKIPLNESKQRLSIQSNISQSSENSRPNVSSTKSKASTLKTSNNIDETDENKEVKSLLDSSGFSILSNDPLKSRRAIQLAYPHFPFQTKEMSYEQHMQRTMKAAEEWLYSGPLGSRFYPHFIHGISAVFSNLCTIKIMDSKKRKSHTINQSFIDVLEAIVGPELYDFIEKPTSLPEEDSDRINAVLKIYENMLHFLILRGAYLPHVSAQYLLSYSDYLRSLNDQKCLRMGTKISLENDSLLQNRVPSHIFDVRSKQCWLDVTLQTYKTLVLNRISVDGLKGRYCSSAFLKSIDITDTASMLSSVHPLTESMITTIENRARANKNNSEAESLLLAWLEQNFEQQRQEDWLKNEAVVPNNFEGKDELPSRKIVDFDNDLSDSLVLIAVTATYCPFLINEFFRNIYIHPRNPEEIIHNGICLVRAWRKIRLGFMITPQEIVRPNCVQMLMLVVHLFQTLPTYIPRAKIKFSSPLTETVIRSLNFTNPTNFPVNYVLQFFGNKSEFFTAVQSKNIFTLKSLSSGMLKIQFHARKIHQTQVYLLLCGSAIGPKFAKNQCFVLDGAVSHFGTVNEYKIKSKLYKVLDQNLKIRVPYKYAAEYKIWMTEEMPANPATIKMERWSEMRLRKVPRRLFLNQKSLIVRKDAYEANLSISIACICPKSRNFWIVFRAKIGDFVIKINSASQTSVTGSITVNWHRDSCICPNPALNIVGTCPLNLSVKIPCRNPQLWDCISQMFNKTLNPNERLFWTRHLDTKIGLRLIHRLMGDYTDSAAKEFSHIFEKSVTYKVFVSGKTNPLILSEEFTIPDVKMPEEQIEMKMHIDKLTPQVYETKLSLISLDGRENRVYRIGFHLQTQ